MRDSGYRQLLRIVQEYFEIICVRVLFKQTKPTTSSIHQKYKHLSLRSALIRWNQVNFGWDFCENREVLRQNYMRTFPWVLGSTCVLAWCPSPNSAAGRHATAYLCARHPGKSLDLPSGWSGPICHVLGSLSFSWPCRTAPFLCFPTFRQVNGGCDPVFNTVLKEESLSEKP